MIIPFTPQLGESITYKFDRGKYLSCIKSLPCPVSKPSSRTAVHFRIPTGNSAARHSLVAQCDVVHLASIVAVSAGLVVADIDTADCLARDALLRSAVT